MILCELQSLCVCLLGGGIISWLADESLSSQEGFCCVEFVCFKAGWCTRQCVPEPISNSEVHYVVRDKNYVNYVCMPHCKEDESVFLRESH
jgi:hypothetical protein